jgi:hypothetical protein
MRTGNTHGCSRSACLGSRHHPRMFAELMLACRHHPRMFAEHVLAFRHHPRMSVELMIACGHHPGLFVERTMTRRHHPRMFKPRRNKLQAIRGSAAPSADSLFPSRRSRARRVLRQAREAVVVRGVIMLSCARLSVFALSGYRGGIFSAPSAAISLCRGVAF